MFDGSSINEGVVFFKFGDYLGCSHNLSLTVSSKQKCQLLIGFLYRLKTFILRMTEFAISN